MSLTRARVHFPQNEDPWKKFKSLAKSMPLYVHYGFLEFTTINISYKAAEVMFCQMCLYNLDFARSLKKHAGKQHINPRTKKNMTVKKLNLCLIAFIKHIYQCYHRVKFRKFNYCVPSK